MFQYKHSFLILSSSASWCIFPNLHLSHYTVLLLTQFQAAEIPCELLKMVADNY